MSTLKTIYIFVLNIILWVWSHFLIFCLSDDANFATIEIDERKNWSFRFSLLSIMLGDYIIYIISYDNKEHTFSLITSLKLEKLEGNNLKSDKSDRNQVRYMAHLKTLSEKNLQIEKEKLLYHIQQEEDRIKTSITKINIYMVAILTAATIVLSRMDFSNINSLTIVQKTMIVFACYSILNICLLFFGTIKVGGISKSTFRELKADEDKKRKIVFQYYYDWQHLKYKANLFVSYVLNFQEWMVLLIVLVVGICDIPTVIYSLVVDLYDQIIIFSCNEFPVCICNKFYACIIFIARICSALPVLSCFIKCLLLVLLISFSILTIIIIIFLLLKFLMMMLLSVLLLVLRKKMLKSD